MREEAQISGHIDEADQKKKGVRKDIKIALQ